MLGRSVVLGVFIAAMPLAVDLPGAADSSRAGTLSVSVAGGGGQFALVSHGCNGEVLRRTHSQLRSGALVIQQRLPGDYVIGIRAGSVQTRSRAESVPEIFSPILLPESTATRHYANPYANPYIAYEGPASGLGVGWIVTDRPLVFSESSIYKVHATAHVYFGREGKRLTLRWMEDVPLESEGHLSIDVGSRMNRRFESGVFAGLFGPYDGIMVGVRGRVWVTPAAAAQIKATMGNDTQYGVYGSITAQLPGPR